MVDTQIIALQCPCCAAHFDSRKWASDAPAPTTKKGTDFHPVYEYGDHNPQAFYVHLCRACGYAGTEDMYRAQDGGYLMRTLLHTHLRWNIPYAATDVTEVYYHAVKCALWGNQSAFEIAHLAINASYHASNNEDFESERYFRRIAIANYTHAMRTHDGVDADKRAAVSFLIGELWRRLGNDLLAADWYRAALEHVPPDDTDFNWLRAAVATQLQAPKDFF